MPKFKTNFSAQSKKMKEQEKGSFKKDERIYVSPCENGGSARTTMRFLPAVEGDVDIPYVKTHTHWFKGPGGQFINNCPKTLGNDCPVCEDNGRLWDEDEQLVRDRNTLKKTYYYSNVLIIEDDVTPSNNGKVFLLRYPKQVYDKIMEVINRQKFPFHPEKGMNFYYVVKREKKGKHYMPDYTGSYFSDAVTQLSSLCDIEKDLEDMFPLAPFIDPTKIKTYAELQKRFAAVMGEKNVTTVQSTQTVEQQVAAQTPNVGQAVAPVEEAKSSGEKFNEEKVYTSKEDEDFFDKMDIK